MMTVLEQVERRVLGAIAFVHAVTGARVLGRLQVGGVGITLTPNRSGLYVVRAADGFGDYVQRFDTPPTPLPAGTNFVVTVTDPQQQFLSRSFTLALPRASTPVGDAQSVLNPLVVALCPAAGAPTAPGWAVLRLRAQAAGDALHTGLVNLLVRVAPQIAGVAPQTAMTDANGEALVAVAGAPAWLPGPGPAAFVSTFTAGVSLVIDTAVARLASAPAANFGAADPDAIAQRLQAAQPGVRAVNAADATLSSGHSRRVVIDVPWP